MVTSELLERLKSAYQAWHDSRGASADEWMGLMADGVELRSVADGAPGLEFSAPRKGKHTAHGYFSALNNDWEMIYHYADEFLADGDRVVVFCRVSFRHRKTGKVAESPSVHRWRFLNGEAVEFFEFYDTAKAFAATRPD